MKQNDYTRFYALLRRMAGDRDTRKETLVSRFTEGRTTSLREMTRKEYDAMCAAMAAEAEHSGLSGEEYGRELKRMRSAVLKRMQRLGVDTTDWNAVDTFCRQPRIAIGQPKPFARLSLSELKAMIRKLQAMLNKPRTAQKVVHVPIFINTDRLPS